MRVHILQHVAFEGAGIIASLCQQKGYEITVTRLYAGELLPVSYQGMTLIVVMGGPMSVLDEGIYPWLADEKTWLQQAIDAGVRILGVCLGAQLLATVLGGRVMANPAPEIGWFAVKRVNNIPAGIPFPDDFHAFHWHGETFTLPADAQLLASSEACVNQAFLWRDQVLALQFHLELTATSINDLCLHCGNDLIAGEWVQTKKAMLAHDDYFIQAHLLMQAMLAYILHL